MIGSPDFGGRFYHLMDSMIGIDQCTVFVSLRGSPEAVVAEARDENYATVVRDLSGRYTETGFLRDPLWQRIKANASGAVEIIPMRTCEFLDRDYRKQFYEKPNIGQELALITQAGDVGVYAGFYREAGHEEFSQSDVERLTVFARPTLATLHKHAEIMDAAKPFTLSHACHQIPVTRDELLVRVRDAMMSEDNGLTPREAEICACIVLGYTVLGMSLNMSISINTVATHRKRAYAKMKISSQNELFARYFATVQQLQTPLRH